MLISDLNHLSTVSEASDVVGGGGYHEYYKKKMKEMMGDDDGDNGDNGDNGGSETSVVVKQIAKSKAKAFSKEGDAIAVSKATNKAVKE